jgi:hypothetical protein
MEIDWRIFAAAFVITAIIFGAIIFSNSMMNSTREDAVAERMASVIQEYEDMQTVLWMSEFLGENATCVAMQSMINQMNKGLWELGSKIDQYRQVTEEFSKDPFYIQQKTEFNRREVLYLSTLEGMKERCSINQTIISYFYRKKELCPDCDAQSFVISDIKKELENMGNENELAVFSFDADMGVVPVELLTKYYNISRYPCVVIEDKPYCGLYDKSELMGIICDTSRLSICPK